VVCDIAAQIPTVPYDLATPNDLDETVALVTELGKRCLTVTADVRRLSDMHHVAQHTLNEFGHIDILEANAGISSVAPVAEMTDAQWQDVIDVNLTGVFNSCRAVVPHMIRRRSGRIVATASIIARSGGRNSAHYVASKWGILGLVKSLALEVATYGVTANAILPGGVNTAMLHNEATYKVLRPDLEHPTRADVESLFDKGPGLLEPADVSKALLFLVLDERGLMNGETLTISGGSSANNAA
jgi:NAD(P)-dependent dehydrogenase (short-subunit alcohol dehydrogenase family)